MRNLKLDLITKIDDLVELEGEWKDLEALSRFPLSGYDWSLCCAMNFYPENSLRIIVLRSAHRIEALAPLSLKKNKSIPRIECLGSSNLYEPCDFIYRSNAALIQLIEETIALNFPFYLHRIPIDSTIADIIATKHGKKGYMVRLPSSSAGFINIDSDWNQYFSQLSSSKRYDSRRKLKIAKKIGQVEFRFYAPRPRDCRDMLPTTFKIEDSGWKQRNRSSLLSNRPLRRFFTEYLVLAAADNTLRIGFMYIDDSPVAVVIGIVRYKKFWLLKNGYDPKWKKCSPGILLLNETVKHCFEQNYRGIEFLGTDEHYIRQLAGDRFHRYQSIAFFPFRLLGLSLLSINAANHLYHRLRR
jgi:CelD/BcsL family acetyltransferase involved in cellulose biosynthesis